MKKFIEQLEAIKTSGQLSTQLLHANKIFLLHFAHNDNFAFLSRDNVYYIEFKNVYSDLLDVSVTKRFKSDNGKNDGITKNICHRITRHGYKKLLDAVSFLHYIKFDH